MTNLEILTAAKEEVAKKYGYSDFNDLLAELYTRSSGIHLIQSITFYLNEAALLAMERVNSWISVEDRDRLPEILKTVWITNGNGWVALGCRVESDGGWHWAESNGVIYIENGEIVSECESDDLDVKLWMPLPKAPTK